MPPREKPDQEGGAEEPAGSDTVETTDGGDAEPGLGEEETDADEG